MTSTQKEHPLHALARLVGGAWHIEAISFPDPPLAYHRFAWEAGGAAISGRSYPAGGGAPSSEGLWYWHPGEGVVRGVFVGPADPRALSEYLSVRAEGDGLVAELATHDAQGKSQRFKEVFTFTGPDRYAWTLHMHLPDGTRQIAEGSFIRKSEG